MGMDFYQEPENYGQYFKLMLTTPTAERTNEELGMLEDYMLTQYTNAIREGLQRVLLEKQYEQA